MSPAKAWSGRRSFFSMRPNEEARICGPAGGRPDRFTLLLAAAAVLGAGLVLLRLASYGSSVGADAANYITAARSLLAGDGLVGLGGGPWVYWPPLYPALLAGGGLFGLDPYAVAGPLNAVIFGLTVLVAGWWLRRHLHSRFLWLWGCLSLALALPLAQIASHALTESVFVLFVTLSLTQIDAHLGGGGRAALIRAAAFSALACLTRYMGVSVVLAAVPLLLAARVAPREKMKRIAIYTLIAGLPVGLWMLRNFLLAGSTTGKRGMGFYSFDFIVDEVLRVAVGRWWLVALTAPVLLALVMAACHAFHRLSRREKGAPVAADVAWGPLRVCGGFALAYLTLLVASMMSGATWHVGSEMGRFLVPLYVPLLFAALLLMDGALRYARKRVSRGIGSAPVGTQAIGRVRALAAFLMLALSLQAALLVALHDREIPHWNAGERQAQAAPRWRNSESVRYIREAALTGTILANKPVIPRLHADSPARHYRLLCEPDRVRPALSHALGRGEVHVLYFHDLYSDRTSMHPCSRQQDEELGSALSREPLLELVAELADGTLYRLRERDFREFPPAMFHSSDAPMEGKLFVAFLNMSHGQRLPGEPWQWEKDGGADSWTSLPAQRSDYGYTPTIADVGHRLRASVYYADQFGNRVKATTKPSEPVQPDILRVLAPLGSEDGGGAAGASEADRGIRSKYDLYLHGNRLIYRNRNCRYEDEAGTRFPLIVYSLDSESGTPERATLDFEWRENSWRNNGTCVAERQLPGKDIFGIHTGQVDRDGNLLWEAEHWIEESRRWLDGYLSQATSGEPAARGVFDIYLGEGSLVFVKDPCARADTKAQFFLHLIPADEDDLPAERKQYGFDNLDFAFEAHGERFDGKCLAEVPLPEYRVSRIRTGQYVPGQGRVWQEDFSFNTAE